MNRSTVLPMPHDHLHLPGREDLLSGGVSGVEELGLSGSFFHPFLELVAGRLWRAVGEVEHGQLLQSVRAYLEIIHLKLFG